MKQLAVLVFSLITILALGQSGDVVFTVKARVYLTPAVDTLYAGRTYSFNIKGVTLKDIVAAAIDNGKVSVTATEIKLRPNNAFNNVRQDTLILMINKNGKQEAVVQKIFKVVKFPELVLTDSVKPATIGNALELYWLDSWPLKKADSVSVEKVRKSRNQLFGVVPALNTLPTIISYKMDVACVGKVLKFSGKDDRITTDMRTALQSLEPGCGIKIYDVQCARPGASNDLTILGPFNIFIKK